MNTPNLPARPTDLGEIDQFCDALWLEDGLAKATLDSYRSDLGRLSLWLANNAPEPLLDLREATLTAFIAHLAKQTRATSQARYLSTLRRFYRWQLGRGRIVATGGAGDKKLGGFARERGGFLLDVKRWLLRHEGITLTATPG